MDQRTTVGLLVAVLTLHCLVVVSQFYKKLNNVVINFFKIELCVQGATGFDCTGKPGGNYPDPADACSGRFYICADGVDSYAVQLYINLN